MTRPPLAGVSDRTAVPGGIGARVWQARAATIGAVALVGLLALRLAGVTSEAVGLPLLGLALVLGLPHGAVDVGAPVLTSRGRTVWAVCLAGYAATATAVYLLWQAAPVPALLALLALAVAHFGAADVEGRSFRGRAIAALALGGVPVVVPLAVHTHRVRPILAELTGGEPDVVVTAMRAGLIVVAAAVVITVALAVRRGDGRAALEPLVLGALFVFVDPLVAFAAYYGLWHSLRQGAITIDETAARLGVGPGRAARIVLSRAALPVAAVVVLGLLLAVSGHLPVVSLALIVVLCLTVPHSLCAAAATLLGPRAGTPATPRPVHRLARRKERRTWPHHQVTASSS